VKFDVVGLGLCAWDRVLLLERYPKLNEKATSISSITSGGGPVPTALAAFAKLGGAACFVGVVGDDAEGKSVRADLSAHGVDISRMIIRKGQTTACAHIWVDKPTGERTVVLDPGKASAIRMSELPRSLIRHSRILLMDGRLPGVAIAAAKWCHQGGGIVLLDAGSPRADFEKLLSVTDHAVVSEDFALGTFPGMKLERILSEIIAYGPKAAVITCGAKGGFWREGDRMSRYRAFPVKALDTTGAGDVFHGGYLYGLKLGWDMARRCRFASAAAALACRGLGGRASLPSLAQTAKMAGISPNKAKSEL